MREVTRKQVFRPAGITARHRVRVDLLGVVAMTLLAFAMFVSALVYAVAQGVSGDVGIAVVAVGLGLAFLRASFIGIGSVRRHLG